MVKPIFTLYFYDKNDMSIYYKRSGLTFDELSNEIDKWVGLGESHDCICLTGDHTPLWISENHAVKELKD